MNPASIKDGMAPACDEAIRQGRPSRPLLCGGIGVLLFCHQVHANEDGCSELNGLHTAYGTVNLNYTSFLFFLYIPEWGGGTIGSRVESGGFPCNVERGACLRITGLEEKSPGMLIPLAFGFNHPAMPV